MRQLLRIGSRLLWRPSVRDEVDGELETHLELLTRRLEADGLSPGEARSAALRRFGNLAAIRDECRTLAHDVEVTMHRQALWNELRQDARYGVRTLRRAPLFTVIAVMTLAIGIGASTAIFSVVHAVLLKSLPYRNADRVLAIWNSYQQGGIRSHTAIAPPEFADVEEQVRAFDAVAAIGRASANLTGDCGGSGPCDPERVAGYAVSTNLFDLLGARAALGRSFVTADAAPESPAVVVLSHALWMRRFGADPGIVGTTVTINGQPRTVVGVMPSSVRFPDAPVGFLRERGELWIPRNPAGDKAEGRGNQVLGVVARLRPGQSFENGRRDLELISGRFRSEYARRYDREDGRWALDALSLRSEMTGEVRRPLLIVLGAVLLLLLIACANVAHLSLARGASRGQEFAVRTALGAGRGRLVRQLVTESLLLGTLAAVAGVILAAWATRGLAALDMGMIPLLDTAGVSMPVLAFAIGAAVLSALGVGILPALRQSQARVHDVLRSGSRGETGRPRRRLRSALVVGEVALAVVILMGAGLLVRSFRALQRVDNGFSTAPALTFSVTLPRARYDSAWKLVALHDQLRARLASVPGVRAVSALDPLPLSGSAWSGSFDVEGLEVAPGRQEPHAEFAVGLPGFVAATGMALVHGREFTAADGADAPPVVLVDERLAATYWPGEDAIGKRVNPGARDWATIVGIVRHVHRAGPRDEGEPQIYMPFAQRPQAPLSYVLRTDLDPRSLVSAVRREVAAVDPELPVARIATMATLQAAATARDRFNALMLVLFATTALLLATVGLYGVVAYLVTQRQGEIGIRLALGGQPADVMRLVMREGLVLAGSGIVLGTATALAAGRILEGLLFGVAPTDPATFVAIAAALVVVASVASAVPARRATRTDPAAALRG